MTQSRLESLIESVVNILIGYCIALASQLILFPLFSIHISLSTNLQIGAWFTVISLIRSYALRRWFNARLRKRIHQVVSSTL
jgi:membrane protein implicated in regulation of membrane protease activity